MSTIKNYQELQETVSDWIMRPEPEIQGRIRDFIRMGEASINRNLRTRQMVNRARVTVTGRYIRLPSDWRRAINIQRVEDDYPLEYLPPAEMDKVRHKVNRNLDGASRGVIYYSFFGNSMELLPSPSADAPLNLEMLYYAEVRPLSDENPENWLLREHPDVYLYAALVHSAPFLKEDERAQVWQGLYAQALVEANDEDANAKRSGSPMSRPSRSF